MPTESTSALQLIFVGACGAVGKWLVDRCVRIIRAPRTRKDENKEALQAVLAELATIKTEMRSELASMSRKMTEEFRAQNERLAAIEGTLQGLIKRVTYLEQVHGRVGGGD